MPLSKVITLVFIAILMSEAGLVASSFSVPLLQKNLDSNILSDAKTINGNSYVTLSIVFQPKNLALLQMMVENHTIINKTQMMRLFIPSSEISNAVAYLKQKGLSVESYLNVITVSGKASEVEDALHGKIVESSFHGINYYQFLGNSPFSNAIITGTNITEAYLSKPNTLYNATQLVAYQQISPKEIYKAYNITYLLSKGIEGNGTAIGILDFYGDPYISSQLQSFDSKYNIPNPPSFNIVPIGPYDPQAGISSGWALEISLDVEYSHLVAPEASIYLYVANPDLPLPSILASIVNSDQVNVVSESFGIPEIDVLIGAIPLSYIQSLIYEYWLGEVEGITFLAAAGDAGGTGYNYFLSPQGSLLFPASIPYVLSVGGTTLYVSGNTSVQTAWSGESIFGATTSGVSSIFPSPVYQGLYGFAKVPDVAALANPYTGVPVLYYYNITELVGGTSVATPLTAGMIDLMTQAYGKLGYVNTLLYSLNDTNSFTKVNFGYDTPYSVNDFNIDGLGYINAGNLYQNLPSVLHQKEIQVATYNSTYGDGQEVTVVVKPNFPVKNMLGEVYNSSNVTRFFTLHFNGTYWVGHFNASGSGVQEIVVGSEGVYGFSYITVGYQAVFISPELAIYPEPEDVPVIVELTDANGSLVTPYNSVNVNIYKYSPETNLVSTVTSVTASISPIFNITIFGQVFQLNTSYYLGYYNFTDQKYIGGIYEAKVNNAFGMDEFVEGIYVVPAVIPAVATEPLVISPGQNVTLDVAEESLGMPNITISFVKEGKVEYSASVNVITYGANSYYLAQVKVPDIPSGYYTIIANATYSSINYTATGIGTTQIYVAPQSLVTSVSISPSGVLYENQTAHIMTEINYFNGSPVKYGTFDAVLVPNFLLNNIGQDQVVVQLNYDHGKWVGNFTVPEDAFGSSQFGSSGYWNVYVEGTSFNGFPTFSPSYLNVSSLEILPSAVNTRIYVLPYVYIKNFDGNFAAYSYVQNANIVDHNATIINSVINNLIVKNGTVTLINSTVLHLTQEVNGSVERLGITNIKVTNITAIGKSNSPSKYQENVSMTQNTSSTSPISLTQNNTNSKVILQFSTLIALMAILAIVIFIALLTRRKFS